MSALVVIMYGVVACSAAESDVQVSPSHASSTAGPGRAHVIGRDAGLRPAGASLPAAQASRLVRSALGTRRRLHLADATFGAPAELSGTIHGNDHTGHADFVGTAYVSDGCGECEPCDSCDEPHSCWCWRCWVRSTCDMVPHAWYQYPDSHGYYYFRPYHYTHLDLQREFITSIGGDPRNPYVDGLFESIYQEMDGR